MLRASEEGRQISIYIVCHSPSASAMLSTLLLSTLLSPPRNTSSGVVLLSIHKRSTHLRGLGAMIIMMLVGIRACRSAMQCSGLSSNSHLYNNQLQHNRRTALYFWERVCFKGGGEREGDRKIKDMNMYYQYHLRPFLIMRDRSIAWIWYQRERKRERERERERGTSADRGSGWYTTTNEVAFVRQFCTALALEVRCRKTPRIFGVCCLLRVIYFLEPIFCWMYGMDKEVGCTRKDA